MKKLLILSTFLLFTVSSAFAQLFSPQDDIPTFRRSDSSVYKMPLAGGLNQPQFSQIDLNSDGKLDLFIFDRSGFSRLCFISSVDNGVVTYTASPDHEVLFPQGKDFAFLRDYNNDGKPDLFTYGYNTQKLEMYKNTHVNYPSFAFDWNMRAYNFDPPPFDTSNFNMFTGNLPDVVDLNQDGDMDVVTNIAYCGSNLTYYRNRAIDDGIGFTAHRFDIPDYCLGNLKEDIGQNLIMLNQPCDLGGRNYKKKHCGVKTLGFFDNDDDGDLDLFFGTSEQLTNPLYFLENGKSDFGMAIDTFISIDTSYFSNLVEAMIPVAPSTSFVDFDLDGKRDLILATNESVENLYDIRQTNNVLAFKNYGTTDDPDFQFVQNDFLNGEMIDFGAHTAPTLIDIDGDGDLDLFIGTNGDDYTYGDSAYHMVYFENIGNDSTADFILRDSNYLNLTSRKLIYIAPTFADVDGDDDFDLFYGKGDGTITYFENIGTETNPSFSFDTDNYENIWVGEDATPYFYDLNGDDVLDLLIGEFDGNINYFENTGSSTSASFALVNDSLGGMLTNELIPKTVYIPVKHDTLVHSFFGNSCLTVGEFGRDRKKCIVTGGADGTLRIFEIPSDITQEFEQDSSQLLNSITNQMYIRDFGGLAMPIAGDLNNDGYSDLLIGNSRGGLHYLSGRNTVSIARLARPKIMLYPNPAQNEIQITLNSAYSKYDYYILDISGRVVQEENNKLGRRINLNQDLSNGVYFIQVSSEGVEYSPEKFILIRE